MKTQGGSTTVSWSTIMGLKIKCPVILVIDRYKACITYIQWCTFFLDTVTKVKVSYLRSQE